MQIPILFQTTSNQPDNKTGMVYHLINITGQAAFLDFQKNESTANNWIAYLRCKFKPTKTDYDHKVIILRQV